MNCYIFHDGKVTVRKSPLDKTKRIPGSFVYTPEMPSQWQWIKVHRGEFLELCREEDVPDEYRAMALIFT
jgi:hypothetical protein